MRRDDVTAVILAGGKATRMGGADKRQLVVDGQTIFERQVAVLAPRVAEIVVSAGRPVAGFRTVADAEPGLGPLAGIAAGLAAARTTWLLVLAGDMPHVSGALVELLMSPLGDECDAVGIRIGGRPEPLCTILRVAPWLPIVRARIATRRLKAAALLVDGSEDDVRVQWIEEAEVREIDPGLHALRNVNAPEDL